MCSNPQKIVDWVTFTKILNGKLHSLWNLTVWSFSINFQNTWTNASKSQSCFLYFSFRPISKNIGETKYISLKNQKFFSIFVFLFLSWFSCLKSHSFSFFIFVDLFIFFKTFFFKNIVARFSWGLLQPIKRFLEHKYESLLLQNNMQMKLSTKVDI